MDEAAKRLGLKQQVVYDLVKRVFLVCIQDELFGRRVTQAGLEDFRANYISLAEYAKSLNRAPRWLLQTLLVKPISGPMIDGCRQYFLRELIYAIDISKRNEGKDKFNAAQNEKQRTDEGVILMVDLGSRPPA